MSKTSDFSFLAGSAEAAARRLLGCYMVRQFKDQFVKLKITETEAYDQSDAASHSYRGKTPRTEVMFGPPGFLYVYFTYGMHYCCNVVVGPEGFGAAVLLRAADILTGEDIVVTNRVGVERDQLTNGPAKLCQALKIDKSLNGHDLRQPPLQLILGEEVKSGNIITTPRIGISKAKDLPLRFLINPVLENS